ncbi:Transmembrane BAX inhibitor motif-containing protein 4 [Entophlyctis luteolus]|nr:Transmembrane BAX inhibitor motif-containing protein 4 [Entophlyctis luteolus]KAJ3349418.1 Transmembrane BAX inhibitor motif-containing protein 4 [Entophlyctis luteolus]KAJ3390846.1 Transmembrane BAX inhibitor motif-containing protein 4 [Entophlyctis sp. JEL0112]
MAAPPAHPPSYADTVAADAHSRHPEAAPLLSSGGFEKPLLVQCDLAIRLNFVRKVYSILAAQFALTTIVSTLFMYNQNIKHFVQSNSFVFLLSAVGGLATLIALMIYRRQEPINRYLLALFTAFESYSVGVVCTLYESETVLQAVILTFVVFIGLTLFTLQSKMKFDGMAPFLFSSLWVLIFASLLEIIFPFSRTVDLIIAMASAVIFSGYIVFDTYMLFNRLTEDDYIVAAVELYLDVVNLFLSILRILGSRDD